MGNIKLDKNNARKHNPVNKGLVNKSLKELGTGRSILIDSDDTIIAGNCTFEEAEKLGIPVKVIETDGKELIALKRIDLKPDDKRRKELAIVDNSATDLSEFKEDIWEDEHFAEVDLSDWGVEETYQSNQQNESASETNYSEKNKEVDVDGFDEKIILKFEYTEDDFHQVKDALLKIAPTREQGLWILLLEKGLVEDE